VGHPAIENKTPFAFESFFLTNEEGRPVFVPVIKAAYSIRNRQELHLAENQLPVNPTGTFNGAAGESSYRYEPETALFKVATDVGLVGHAWTSSGAETEVVVSLHAGALSKRARVIGDRYWTKSLGATVMTDPEPFESISLIYERAFGGRGKDNSIEPRNPVGRGFCSGKSEMDDVTPLPNIEDPHQAIRHPEDRPAPMGFGFLAPNWQPRSSFAGTYDDAWEKERMPLLPRDFDRRFFNAASPGLVASGYFNGDEAIYVEHVLPDGPIAFRLPGLPPPVCRAQIAGTRDAWIETHLDTITVDADDNLLLLVWRGYRELRNGPHDLVSVEIGTEGEVRR